MPYMHLRDKRAYDRRYRRENIMSRHRDQAVVFDPPARWRRVALRRDGNRLIQMLFYPGGLEVENDGVFGVV